MATVEEAVARGVLEVDDGRYAFLHLRVREALLADMDETARRSAHQRIAEVMDGAARALGVPDRTGVLVRAGAPLRRG